jgi:hypothetical protein
MAGETYRVRFRFRVGKKLNIADAERRFTVAGREIVLASGAGDGMPISESEWLVINARGFELEESAREFGYKLRVAAQLSSVACRLGTDAGIDLPTSSLGAAFRTQIQEQTGVTFRANVHGIDVFPDEPNVFIFSVSATATVLSSPEPFLPTLESLHPIADTVSDRTRDIALLLNYALMRTEPVAQIVFAVSAVEMLGQDETWSIEQRRLLAELAHMARRVEIGTPEEHGEVAAAISRSLHRITLRQGVHRLLDRLGLGHLKKPWDDLYSERSTLVHGLAPRPGADYGDLATRTMTLCGQILLRAIADEIDFIGQRADTYYRI